MTDFEVIVVDAHSDDHTLNLAEKFPIQLPHLTFITSLKRNISYQRNLGAKRASGKILLFIDADTQLPAYFLDGIKYKLGKSPADVFTTWIKPDSANAQDKAIATIINLFFEASKLLDLHASTGFGAMLGFRAAAFRHLKGFNPHVYYSEDQEIIRRAIDSHFTFVIYPDPYFIYSFRRLRQQGTLNTLRQIAKAQVRVLTNSYAFNLPTDYPTGGHHFPPARKNSQ